MARKAKVKVKRGKVKFKVKSHDAVLLHGHDHIQALLGAAMASVVNPPALELPDRTMVARQGQRSLPPLRGD